MAKNKNLGMGLDLLLTAGEGKGMTSGDETNRSQAKETMDQALEQDEQGNFLEAYYLYRKLIDLGKDHTLFEKENAILLSQALNNAAIILYEHGNMQKARAYLEKSLVIEPDNKVAKSNHDQLKTAEYDLEGG